MDNDLVDIREIEFPEPLPEPQRISKIIRKIDSFSENEVVPLDYNGNPILGNLFYLYLFKKYKSDCMIRTSYDQKSGLILDMRHIVDNESGEKQHIKNVIINLVDCIKRNIETIILPVVLILTSGSSHANVLIYRRMDNTIEHFEPHGATISHRDKQLVFEEINRFILQLNSKIKKNKLPSIHFKHSYEVCPRLNGLQAIEHKLPKLIKEGGGYCLAWSMFFTELVLKNPSVSSSQLMTLILKRLDGVNAPEYLTKVIRGYVSHIYTKTEKYFSAYFGRKMTVEEISHVIRDFDILKNLDLNVYFNEYLDYELEHINESVDFETYLNDQIERENKNLADLEDQHKTYNEKYINYIKTAAPKNIKKFNDYKLLHTAISPKSNSSILSKSSASRKSVSNKSSRKSASKKKKTTSLKGGSKKAKTKKR
jgi:hypothetical protein